MSSFSRRNEIVPAPTPSKPGTITNQLRTLLWNDFDAACRPFFRMDYRSRLEASPPLTAFFRHLWSEEWYQETDQYPGPETMMRSIKTEFLEGHWYAPFDILELALVAEKHVGFDRTGFRESISRHLDQQASAYTLLGDHFVQRMSETEAVAVEDALGAKDDAIQTHFASAFKKLNDRHDPDYRNSIKESISAVECVCKQITGEKKGDLHSALQKLNSQRTFYPAFKQSLEKLYAWTSDESGVRHSIKDAPKVTRADAQYMLVACSALVSYLLARGEEEIE